MNGEVVERQLRPQSSAGEDTTVGRTSCAVTLPNQPIPPRYPTNKVQNKMSRANRSRASRYHKGTTPFLFLFSWSGCMVWRNQERCRVAWSEAYECHAQKEGLGRSRGENNTQSEHEDEGYLELYIPISHTDRVRSIIAMRLTAGKRSRQCRSGCWAA